MEKKKTYYLKKTCIVSSLAISKLIYVGSILPLPNQDFLKKIKCSIFNFIWNKRDRIKRDTIIGKIEDGGVGLVEIELKLKVIKASLVKRLVDESCMLNNIFQGYIKKHGIRYRLYTINV